MVEVSRAACLGAEVWKPCIKGMVRTAVEVGLCIPDVWNDCEPTIS